MELEITENNNNPLLNRQEVQIVIKHESDATPKRNQVIKSLSEKLKAKKDLIIIDHLKNKYGKTETQGYAKIYTNKDSLNLIETKPSLARHTNTGDESKKEKKVEKASKEETKEEVKEKVVEKEKSKKAEEGETNEKD
ncbi:MAG: 30S ribosomal protein S24e [Methanobacteriota archaeon]|jgi:ribosomal protein S24E|uniref:Small ribosomal subunit protein eS24 n=1 Tax=Marine Group III euryarchaeote TaxID=2173149 RepID=A0A7J4GQJ1_9ARCH|nr:MAG: 30S ribosomal protein S24e [Euryarchaeota archaeon]HIF36907.1 30S ribosomal protein S24e [Marine Group III euryarchaeote]